MVSLPGYHFASLRCCYGKQRSPAAASPGEYEKVTRASAAKIEE